jgi:hypothetical protein
LRTGCLGEYLDPKKIEMTGGCRGLHKEELHNLDSSDIVRMMKSKDTDMA